MNVGKLKRRKTRQIRTKYGGIWKKKNSQKMLITANFNDTYNPDLEKKAP